MEIWEELKFRRVGMYGLGWAENQSNFRPFFLYIMYMNLIFFNLLKIKDINSINFFQKIIKNEY